MSEAHRQRRTQGPSGPALRAETSVCICNHRRCIFCPFTSPSKTFSFRQSLFRYVHSDFPLSFLFSAFDADVRWDTLSRPDTQSPIAASKHIFSSLLSFYPAILVRCERNESDSFGFFVFFSMVKSTDGNKESANGECISAFYIIAHRNRAIHHAKAADEEQEKERERGGEGRRGKKRSRSNFT